MASTAPAAVHKYTFQNVGATTFPDVGSAAASGGGVSGNLQGTATQTAASATSPGGLVLTGTAAGTSYAQLAPATGGASSLFSTTDPNASVTIDFCLSLPSGSTARVWERVFDFGTTNGASGAFFFTPNDGGTPACGAVGLHKDGYWADRLRMTQAWPRDGKLHHGAVVYDGSTKTMSIYFDGALQSAMVTTQTTFGTLAPQITNFYLGRSNWPDADLLGTIASFSITNSALTAAQIQQRFQTACTSDLLPPTTTTTAPPTAPPTATSGPAATNNTTAPTSAPTAGGEDTSSTTTTTTVSFLGINNTLTYAIIGLIALVALYFIYTKFIIAKEEIAVAAQYANEPSSSQVATGPWR